jgi:hypothetical protein
MKRQILKTELCLIVAVGLSCCPRLAPVHAQHSISTKAGLVSRIRGQVFIQHAQGEAREPVSPELQMMDGDRLATEFMSRAEILLNSAAYLRLDEWAEARAVNTRLTEARFELLRGTFVIQAGNPYMLRPMGMRGASISRQNPAGKLDEALAFELVTPHGIVTIGKDGLYQISIEPSSTRIDVFEGEVALGGRLEAIGNKVQKVKSGRRVRLTGSHASSPAITALKLKPYDDFDGWRFQIDDHGIVVRVEGEAIATWGPGQDQHHISPEFQVKAGQTLSTEKSSYFELRINSGTFLSLNQLTRIRAVKSETGEAVFELLHGAIIIDSAAAYPMRPIKIITARATFTVKHGSSARFDVNPSETSVLVRRGEVRDGESAVSHGRRLLLNQSTPRSEEVSAGKKDAYDNFDRWSMGLLRAGIITRHEGRVILERQGGARLDLEKNPPQLQAQLLEGAHLSTEPGGRATLVAGPSSIHVNENTEIVAVSSSEREREFEVVRGAAIVYVETASAIYSKTRLKVSTPHGLAEISGSGEYRFDVDPSGTRIQVRSGSLLISTGPAQQAKAAVKLREKQTAFLKAGGGTPQISNAPDTPDDFDQWSIGARQFPFQRIVRNP